MGITIINSTLSLMFKDRSTAAAELGSTLDSLVLFKLENAESHDNQAFWKGANANSITLNDFLDFVVQPYVAILLIKEDLGITEMEAEATRIKSRRYGIKFNYQTDDGRVDEITMENVISAKVCLCFIPIHQITTVELNFLIILLGLGPKCSRKVLEGDDSLEASEPR